MSYLPFLFKSRQSRKLSYLARYHLLRIMFLEKYQPSVLLQYCYYRSSSERSGPTRADLADLSNSIISQAILYEKDRPKVVLLIFHKGTFLKELSLTTDQIFQKGYFGKNSKTTFSWFFSESVVGEIIVFERSARYFRSYALWKKSAEICLTICHKVPFLKDLA